MTMCMLVATECRGGKVCWHVWTETRTTNFTQKIQKKFIRQCTHIKHTNQWNNMQKIYFDVYIWRPSLRSYYRYHKGHQMLASGGALHGHITWWRITWWRITWSQSRDKYAHALWADANWVFLMQKHIIKGEHICPHKPTRWNEKVPLLNLIPFQKTNMMNYRQLSCMWFPVTSMDRILSPTALVFTILRITFPYLMRDILGCGGGRWITAMRQWKIDLVSMRHDWINFVYCNTKFIQLDDLWRIHTRLYLVFIGSVKDSLPTRWCSSLFHSTDSSNRKQIKCRGVSKFHTHVFT